MPVEGIGTLPSTDPSAVEVAVDMVGTKAYQVVKLDMGGDELSVPLTDTDLGRLPVGGASLGNPGDAAAAADNSTTGLIALLKRTNQRLTSILTQLTTAITSILKQTSATATVPVTTAVSGAVNIQGYQVTGIFIPSTFDGSVIRFEVSPDNTNWSPLYDMTNTIVEMTVSASRAYPVWGELSGWNYIRVLTVTTQTTSDTVFTLALSSGR